jgi:hypothetical protein
VVKESFYILIDHPLTKKLIDDSRVTVPIIATSNFVYLMMMMKSIGIREQQLV